MRLRRGRTSALVLEADVDVKLALAASAAVFRIAILTSIAVALGGCSDSCENSLIRRADAPDWERSAVMFQRDCGATTGFSTQISLTSDEGLPSGGGNIFRADDNHGAAADEEWGGPWAEIAWLGPDHLQIRYAANSRIFLQEDEVSGVKISYQQVSR
jgi:hypothetical protein